MASFPPIIIGVNHFFSKNCIFFSVNMIQFKKNAYLCAVKRKLQPNIKFHI